mmetsp:Transcript_29415/g.61518  ORF Transcript_29415/g.61518 Transcript_29415/m.61518 type:complete len:90 (+) Transcript_29415:484-753(+)
MLSYIIQPKLRKPKRLVALKVIFDPIHEDAIFWNVWVQFEKTFQLLCIAHGNKNWTDGPDAFNLWCEFGPPVCVGPAVHSRQVPEKNDQ